VPECIPVHLFFSGHCLGRESGAQASRCAESLAAHLDLDLPVLSETRERL